MLAVEPPSQGGRLRDRSGAPTLSHGSRIYFDMNDPALRRGQVARLVPWN
jgi:hypothetical protein